MKRICAALRLVAVTGILALATHSALAQGPTPAPELVAVMDIEGVGASKNQVLAVSDRLREELLNSHKYKLVDRSEMSKILDEQAFQQAGCTSQECAVKAGKVLGVRKLVTGRLNKVEDDLWLMSAMMVDVETAETLQAASIQLDGSFRNLLSDGVGRLAVKLGTPASAMTVAAVMQAPRAGAGQTAQPTKGGNLQVSGIDNDAEVFLNGLTRGSGSKQIAALIPGSYQLEVRRKGFHTWKQTVNVASGATVEAKPVFEQATMAVFPIVRSGSWRSKAEAWGKAITHGAFDQSTLKVTHTAYPVNKKAQDLSTDKAITDNTWSFFGNPNSDFVGEKAKALGIDKILLVKLSPDQGQGSNGTYKFYLYNANSGLMHVDSGPWPGGQKGQSTVREKVTAFIKQYANVD